MASGKFKSFLFRHGEKLLLGVAAAGFIYALVYNITSASAGGIVSELRERAQTVEQMIKNPAPPPPPGPPVPTPVAGALKPPVAPLAPSNPFVLRLVQQPVQETQPVQALAGVAPPGAVKVTSRPGANVVEWWRAPGQGTDVWAEIYKVEKANFPGSVPSVVERGVVATRGFSAVAQNVEPAEDGHGVYEDTNIIGEVEYLYAVASIRVAVQQTGTQTDPDAYWRDFYDLLGQGVPYEEALQIMGEPPSEGTGPKKQATPQEWGNLFRTAVVKTAIPIVFELKAVTEDRDTGEPVGRVQVRRLHLGVWYPEFFSVRKGDAIGAVVEKSVRTPDGKMSRQELDLRTGATVVDFVEVEQEIPFEIRGRQMTRVVKTWKMIYEDKDGNIREMLRTTGR